MHHQGQLIRWKDDRGFGFIQPSDGGKDVFLHISALQRASRRPLVGDTVLYELVVEPDGKRRAVKASIQGATLAAPAKPAPSPRRQNTTSSTPPNRSRRPPSTPPQTRRPKARQANVLAGLIGLGAMAGLITVALTTGQVQAVFHYTQRQLSLGAHQPPTSPVVVQPQVASPPVQRPAAAPSPRPATATAQRPTATPNPRPTTPATNSRPADEAPAPPPSPTQAACVIKGNISWETGNRLYHVPGMEDYEITKIDPLKGERWFCTEDEAIKNGWRKAPR